MTPGGAEHIKIADVYAEQGEHKLAMEHYRKSLAMRQEGLGEEHPLVSTSTCCFTLLAGPVDPGLASFLHTC